MVCGSCGAVHQPPPRSTGNGSKRQPINDLFFGSGFDASLLFGLGEVDPDEAKRQDKIRKVTALRDRASTPGERQAAQAALDRLQKAVA